MIGCKAGSKCQRIGADVKALLRRTSTSWQAADQCQGIFLHVRWVRCNKTGRWPALFLTLPLPCGGHFITLHYSTLPWGGLFITLHYSTLPCGGLFITLHYSTLLGRLSLLYSTCVRFMVAGGDLFVTPPLWHPASVAVRTLS